MKVVVVGAERRVCRLQPGEVKRYPTEGVLVGFYVACPACGYRNFVLGHGRHVIEQPALTVSPGMWCDGPRCDAHLHIRDGELVVSP